MPSRIPRIASAAIVAAALAVPSAQASQAIEPGSGAAGPPEDAAPAVTTVIDEGFDWGSAAIGAGGASMLILLSLAGAARVGGARAHFHGA